ncbi:MAG: B12-binding domain-containing radical SAM protein [Deltaproteobacteria bacterium]|nr:B12-binding domain-containing radical SAM protein [Deltaproteobacteria bacterium]
MRLTLIQPAMGHDGGHYVRSWQMEPLSIATLASITPKGHEITFIDDRLEPIPYDAPADLVAITVETYTALRAYQIAAEYRARDVKVVMGGYHPTLVPDEAETHADAIVIGDAEYVWRELLADAAKGTLAKRYVSRPNGTTVSAAPDRSIFAGKRYLPLGLVESGRGCRFACDFCAVTAFSQAKYRTRSPVEVAQEIERAGYKRVFIVDDNLTADPARAKALLRELAPLKIQWVSQASIHVADDPEMLRLLEKSGCTLLLIGFESIDRDSLKAMNKTFNRGAPGFDAAIGKLRGAGVKLYGTFVFGYDTDVPDVFERTLDFAMQQKLFLAAFNHLQPFPGTPLYRRFAEERRLLYDKWWLTPGYRFGTIAFKPKTMAPEALFERLMGLRRRFYSYAGIFKRATDFDANVRSVSSLGLHFIVNQMLRRELNDKWQTPLGDAPRPAAVATAVA